MGANLKSSAKLKVKFSLVKFAIIIGAFAILTAIVIFFVNNFYSTKDIKAETLGKGETALTIGTGTNYTSLPINRYYDNSVYEVIYLQSEISQSGDIAKLAFDKQSGSNSTVINNVKIYMMHTSATQLNYGNYSLAGYSLVYSGAFPNNSIGWNEITLDNTFEYNNSDNLQILIVKENESWTYDYPKYNYSYSSSSARYRYWDGTYSQTYLYTTSIKSNIKLTISSSSAPPPSQYITNPRNGQLIITEYSAKGVYSNYKNEFIELYNLADSAIDLSNCNIKLFDNNNNQKYVTCNLSGTIEPDSFFVIAVRNSGNKTPTSALDYDLQIPNPGWSLGNKQYVKLYCNNTVIDNVGCASTYMSDANYERTDYLEDGTNRVEHWKSIPNTQSSAGTYNLSDMPTVVPIASNVYVEFGSNDEGEPGLKIKSNGSNAPGNTSVKIKRGKVHADKPAGKLFIKRYMTIEPENQPDNVEMVFYYQDSELNGATEMNLNLFCYYNNIWTNVGGVVDPINNTVTASNISHFSDWTVGEDPDGGGQLPVELLKFNAEYLNNQVEISWSTASETNNDYFTIEKSIDASNWKFIINVKGAGNSNSINEYSTIDDDKISGTIYYRLKQTDYDGKFKYYPPVAVNVLSHESEILISTVSPNPFRNDFSIKFDATSKEAVIVLLYNIRGQLVFSETITPTEGSNEYQYTDSENLSNGYYLLTLKQSGKYTKGLKLLKR
ncbi:MAG: lamin tail domain-containing protein [Saprospiraceae bacterium]|nr:lamin tail domain-containing protein [Saprospiraceae bacterium]